jgi:uncharacterized lipoprotein YddW (UPF0748 family)
MRSLLFIYFFFTSLLPGCKKESDNPDVEITPGIISLPDHFQTGILKNDSVFFYLPYGTNLSSIKINVVLSQDQTLSVPNGNALDLSKPQQITIMQGKARLRLVLKAVVPAQNPTAVRGVWISNVGSSALSSPENISQTVNTLDELGFNSAFVVVYNKSMTLHRSSVLKQVLGVSSEDNVQLYPGWDPLKTFIEKAHAKGIKVIAWFEYGFASHYAGMPSPLIVAHPDWAALDINQANSMKNNFYWLNGFNPAVQKFLTDLITEVVRNYDVDGVQGDDRLPAMPINSGYDNATVQAYMQETKNPQPSSDTDAAWMQWRASRLTTFGEQLYNTVKAIKPGCTVAFSPSVSGWSYQNYLQQWDKWLEKGFADIISPQLYRNESQGLKAYTDLIDKDLADVLARDLTYKKKYFPGILVKSGTYGTSDVYLSNCIKYNRSKGIEGEVVFYFDGIESNRKVYKAFYPVKANFPVTTK